MSDNQTFHAYCDESNDHDGAKKMVYGGLVIAAPDIPVFQDRMMKWRTDSGMHGELKWTKIKGHNWKHYCTFVDLFCELSARDIVHFKSVVFNKERINYVKYFDRDKLRGRYTFFYHFLLHKFGCYATTDGHRLHVYFDNTTDKYPLSEFGRILNNGICKKYGRSGQILRGVWPLDSHDCDLIQMADVLMGAIGFQNNGRQGQPGTSVNKESVASHICKCMSLPTLCLATGPTRNRFSIWQFKLSA